MKNFTKNKKIIIISIFITLIFNVVSAETFKQNGLVFIKGEHQPKKQVFEDRSKYKTLKALEVYKQPAHGKKLPFEQTEEYIESQKDLLKIQQVNSVFNQSSEIEKKTLLKKTSDALSDLNLESEPKSIFSIIVDSIKKLWNMIFDIIFRLDNVEKRLDSLENNNEGNVKIGFIGVGVNPSVNIEIQDVDIQVEEETQEADSEENPEESSDLETENENVDSENQEEEKVVESNDEEASNTDSENTENTGDNMDDSESQDESDSDNEGIDDSEENSSGEENDQDNLEESQEQEESLDSENQTTTTETTE